MIQPITCPICRKQLTPDAMDSADFPFCSPRCKQVDLARWLDGKYSIVEQMDPSELSLEPTRDDLWPDEA